MELSIFTLVILTLSQGREVLEHDNYRLLITTMIFTAASTIITFLAQRHHQRLVQIVSFIVLGISIPRFFLADILVSVESGRLLFFGAPATLIPRWTSFLAFLMCLGCLYLLVLKYLSNSRTVSVQSEPNFQKNHLKQNPWRFYVRQPYLPTSMRAIQFGLMTFVTIVITGINLALPVGPLSDEGMVLFMEGGCDWGDSSLFFMSKLGVLVAINWCAIWSLRHRASNLNNFMMHFVFLLVLGSFWWADTSCDNYYGHPQGNLGQMSLEAMSFGILLVLTLPTILKRTPKHQIFAIILMNLYHVAVFYFGLLFTDHWTWLHTGITCFLLLVPGVLSVKFHDSNHRRAPAVP